MRTSIAAIIGATIALAITGTAVASPGDRTADDLVAARLDETGTPGAAMTIIEPGEQPSTTVFGTDGNGAPVTPDTSFLWGSVAKPLTATLILRLIDSGDLTVDDDVTTYLPWFEPTWNAEPAEVTVGELLTHTGGLPSPQDSTTTDRADGQAVTERAEELATVELSARPGTSYIYSSDDYLLLGAIVESLSGRPFTEVVNGFATDIGMADVITDGRAADRRLPPGHSQFLGYPMPHNVAYDDSGIPYGYLASDIGSMARFGQSHLDGTAASTAILTEAHHPQVDSSGDGYGYGWSIGTVADSDVPMVWHSGAAPGYQAVLVLLPDSGHVLALAQNTFTLARDAQLLDAAMGVAALLAGVEAGVGSAIDPVFIVLPVVFMVVGGVFGLAGLLLLRTTKSRKPLWSAVIGLGVPAGAFLLLPAAVGVSLPFIALWLPDVWAGLWTASIGAALWAGCRLYRRPRGAEANSRPSGQET